MHALLVEPDTVRRILFSAALGSVARVCAPEDFVTARRTLTQMRFDLIVANICLGAYNGLHLVHLVRDTDTRCVVYTHDDSLSLGRLAQATGAFYEHYTRAPKALPGYLTGALPPRDRRDPTVVDRRCGPLFRGGRRSADDGGALQVSSERLM
jgi:hypothetical protein